MSWLDLRCFPEKTNTSEKNRKIPYAINRTKPMPRPCRIDHFSKWGGWQGYVNVGVFFFFVRFGGGGTSRVPAILQRVLVCFSYAYIYSFLNFWIVFWVCDFWVISYDGGHVRFFRDWLSCFFPWLLVLWANPRKIARPSPVVFEVNDLAVG